MCPILIYFFTLCLNVFKCFWQFYWRLDFNALLLQYYQTLFRDGECFLHVVSLLNSNLDEANGEKLVLNVLQTLTCLLASNDTSKVLIFIVFSPFFFPNVVTFFFTNVLFRLSTFMNCILLFFHRLHKFFLLLSFSCFLIVANQLRQKLKLLD